MVNETKKEIPKGIISDLNSVGATNFIAKSKNKVKIKCNDNPTIKRCVYTSGAVFFVCMMRVETKFTNNKPNAGIALVMEEWF